MFSDAPRSAHNVRQGLLPPHQTSIGRHLKGLFGCSELPGLVPFPSNCQDGI